MQLQTSGRLVASRGSHLALPAAQACRMDLPGCSLRLWLQQHLLENVDKRTKQPSCPEMPFCLQQTCAQSANRLEPGRGSHRQRALTSVCLASSISREVLSRADRQKLDTGSDNAFYGSPRIVHHIDDGFRQQLTQLYREKLPRDGVILDLMSSWVSHLPEDAAYSQVVGHGMNAQELARNKRLESFWLRNLNEAPDGWATADCTFDAVICTVSVQYLQYPERVFAEIYRVLKPGGICIISFSSRLFYQKAIQAWRDNSAFGRINLVKQYFQCVPGFTQPEVVREVTNAPPLKLNGLDAIFKTLQRAINLSQGNDPFYAVIAHRNYRPLTD